jgi:hypothetical protein
VAAVDFDNCKIAVAYSARGKVSHITERDLAVLFCAASTGYIPSVNRHATSLPRHHVVCSLCYCGCGSAGRAGDGHARHRRHQLPESCRLDFGALSGRGVCVLQGDRGHPYVPRTLILAALCISTARLTRTPMTAAIDSRFKSNFADAANNGVFRGAYHVGLPTSTSSGASQAQYFLTNGGLCIPLRSSSRSSSHCLMQARGLVTGSRSLGPSGSQVRSPVS